MGDADPALRWVGSPSAARSTLWLLIHADLRRAAWVRALLDFLVPQLLAEPVLVEHDRT